MKIVVILFVLLIIGSMASALFFLVKDRGTSTRTVRALTWRVVFSIFLFAMLMLGFHFGILPGRV